MYRQALQPYARESFKRFFQLHTARSAATESAKLKDIVEHMDGLAADAQLAALVSVEKARRRELPPPLTETQEALRRHNSSLLRLEGQCVYGRVSRLGFYCYFLL